MPPEVSSVRVRIGRRLLVRRISPGLGTRCRLCARVCSLELNSPRSARLKAHVSTTCSPWVLMTVTVWPADTNAALPRRAGISIASRSWLRLHRLDGDHVDFDNSAPCQRGDADRGMGRTSAIGKMGREDLVHR